MTEKEGRNDRDKGWKTKLRKKPTGNNWDTRETSSANYDKLIEPGLYKEKNREYGEREGEKETGQNYGMGKNYLQHSFTVDKVNSKVIL